MVVKISEIVVRPGRRSIMTDHVQELAKSIAASTLLNPITIDRNYALIAGLHRLEAVKFLGWTEIECTISDLEGLPAELAEIDENFLRKNLSGVEYDDLLLRRKEIYEELHPETKAGIAQALAMNRAIGNNVADKMSATSKPFIEDTAETLGVTPRTVRRHIQTAKNLTQEAKNIIKSADVKISKKDAMKLSRLEPEQQREAAALLASGDIQSIAEYTAERSEAEQTEAEPDTPLFRIGGKKFATFAEGVADLKNPDKDFSCTPDDFLAEVTAFVRKFHQEIEWYNNPYYEEVFPALSPEQLDYLRGQMESISAAADELYNNVERTIKK